MRFKAMVFALLFAPAPVAAQTLFPNSVVSNNIDFITAKDRSTFHCLGYLGQERAEMPDKRSNALFQDDVHRFRAQFADGTGVDLFVARAFSTPGVAKSQAMKVVHPLGKLPTFMRRGLSHVVIHKGDETAFAESEGHFFVLYSDNMAKRIRTHDLEETVFHEAVHATLDAKYARSGAWRQAQRRDPGYVTDYARANPRKEDLAESALFAYALLMKPGRLPADVAARLEQVMPNRLAFFRDLFPKSSALMQKVGPVQGCQ